MAARMVLRTLSTKATHCNHLMQKRWKSSGSEQSHRLDRLEEVVSHYVKVSAASSQRTDAAISELAENMARLAQATASFNRKLEDYIGVESKISEIEMTRAAQTFFQEDGFKDGTFAHSSESDSKPAAQPHVANT
eukprot:TRINITY_DN942_c0_g3_i9.p1 TRINITY_DN942_c0_g3~~TRINITY_DN942_c0_g3_i9.p1  ORF type:complete len:142 (+),score=24.41 TRINITY_DN942_c0_g3_i9:23-427(+)